MAMFTMVIHIIAVIIGRLNMTMQRLLELLDKWRLWMRSDNHRLGYPNKSILISSGGSAEDAFEEMYNASEDDNVRTLDSVISDLEKPQRDAIYYRFLNSGPKPNFYELKLEMAMDNLLTIAGRKINA